MEENVGGYRTRSRSGSNKRHVEEIGSMEDNPNCHWNRNVHGLLFLIFFIIDIFDVSYDCDSSGLGELPHDTFLCCCLIMQVLVNNIIFLHEKYLFSDVNPDYTMLRDLIILFV